MIDIHCHILPGIDDGPQDMQAAVKMATVAVKDGIRTVIATPHCYDGVYDCQTVDIRERCRVLNDTLKKYQISLEVLPGAEIRLTPELIERFLSGAVMTLGDSRKALLLELPEMFIPEAVENVISTLRDEGVRSIIAHPERNSLILSRNNILKILQNVGAEFQITADSLLGKFGKCSKQMAETILKMDAPCYIASDAHCAKRRKPQLSKAFKRVIKLIGREAALEMLEIDLCTEENETKFALA